MAQADTDEMFSLRFVNSRTRSLLSAIFSPPTFQSGEGVDGSWKCTVDIDLNGITSRYSLSGATKLQSFLLALDFVRRQFPRGEEEQWNTDEGIPLWIELPRTLPYSWGYDLYRSLSDLLDAEETRFIDRIERLRQAAENKPGPDSDQKR